MTIAVWTVLFLGVSYYYGMGQARTRQTFLVRQSSPKYVLLRVYGDRAVIAQFDRSKHVILPVYEVVPFTDGDATYQRERLGQMALPTN